MQMIAGAVILGHGQTGWQIQSVAHRVKLRAFRFLRKDGGTLSKLERMGQEDPGYLFYLRTAIERCQPGSIRF